jgi:toxin ParE1/3/4
VAERRRFAITQLARRDLDYVADWIRTRSGRARAQLVVGRIMAACQLLAQQPLAGRPEPELGEDVRSFVVHPYLVVYRPRRRSIEVLRVIHGARDRNAAWREPESDSER